MSQIYSLWRKPASIARVVDVMRNASPVVLSSDPFGHVSETA
jgi:hypothetical protein